jgi:hypothetical protein
MKPKPQANNFACGGHFGPPFFEVKISRQAQSHWKKFEGQKAGEDKSAVLKKHGTTKFYSTILVHSKKRLACSSKKVEL